MREFLRGGAPETVAIWKELVEDVSDRNRRPDYGAATLQFAELTNCDTIWRQALEGWNVEESRISKEWEAKAVAKAEATTRREDFLRVVRLRFSGNVPTELLAAVEKLTDSNELARWLDLAVTATDLAQIQTTVLGKTPS